MDANYVTPKELRDRMRLFESLIETPMGVTKGQSLIEAKGWKEIVEDIPGDERKLMVAAMLENNKESIIARKAGGILAEDTQSLQIGNWEKFGFPVISMVAENLIAPELVAVQPLQGPSGNVFYMSYVAGQDKGSIKKGDTIWDPRGGHATSREHSSEKIPAEQIGTGDASTTVFSGTLSYTPVRPGTLVIEAGSVVAKDDGNGGLSGTGISSGTINYQSGAWAVTYSSAPASGAVIAATYWWNSEGSTNLPQINFQITSSPIYAVRHALRGRWSMEAEQMLQALHGLKAEGQVSAAISAEIQFEIDRLILQQLWNIAGAGTNTWDAAHTSSISFTEHKLSFVDAINELSAFIYRATSRVMANWVLVGVQGMTILINHPLFEPASTKSEVDGVTFLGTLNKQYKVYVDPHTAPNEYLVGYKGDNFMRTGFIFAPWLLLYSTNTIALDDLTFRKGFASSFGHKAVNSKYYAKGTISNYPTSFAAGA
jgi:hypothetical protein